MESKSIVLQQTHSCPLCRTGLVRSGSFRRKHDQKRIQRYICRGCRRTFSDSTFCAVYKQKKPYLNSFIFGVLVGGFSQRETAKYLHINRKTVVRKFLFLGHECVRALWISNRTFPKVDKMQFDDMESFEHTRCKPVSITLAVQRQSRRILGFRVSQMPAKGRLSKISRQKYGPRKDFRPQARQQLFTELKDLLADRVEIESDMSPHYPKDVKAHFPNSIHRTYKGRRACVVGQGELKRGGYDPLFSLNHTAAMLRANINRMIRRTWCTTKKIKCLNLHIAMYAFSHNSRLEGA